MSIQCEKCGGELQVRGYEQELGQPKTRQWTTACPVCGQVQLYDSAWLRVRPGAVSAPKFTPRAAGFSLNTPAMAG
ncbi:MAG: hypothetical protein NT031_08950 [Planctomycetota bacterium]|nr:hypothetical protein [Planctomycetota bacterium]